MADIFDWDATPSNNTTVDGINIATGMPVQNVDNALRAILGTVRNSFDSGLESFLAGLAGLPLANGGTGATTAADARTNLGLGTSAVENTVPISKGGTGNTTAAAALTALGGVGVVSATLASPGHIKLSLPTYGNFMIAWGTTTVRGDSYRTATYETAFSSFSIPVISGTARVDNSAEQGATVTSATTTGFTFYTAEGSAANTSTGWYIAVGV